MSKIKLDLHEMYNKGSVIDTAILDAIEEAREKGIKEVEIIHGKGSGQLKKRVLRLLHRKDVKGQWSRINKDSRNFGRLFVYFK